MLAGRLEYVEERIEVVLVILDGLGYGFADGLERREVDDGVDLVFGKEVVYRGLVAEVHLDEGEGLAEYGADALVVGLVAVGHVVRNDHVVTGLRQFDRYMASDKSGSAGDKYCFAHFNSGS